MPWCSNRQPAENCPFVAVPHALEPTYAVACERCVDLTRFYHVEETKKRRTELMLLTDAYRDHYRDAYHILCAADEVESERRTMIHAQMDFAKLKKRMNGIAARELRGKSGHRGRIDYAFLGGATHFGDICRFDTAEALCPRIYELCDSAGLTSAALKAFCDTALAQGEYVLACPSPDRPSELKHVLLPERGVALITSDERTPYTGKAYRRLRIDAMANENLSRTDKAKLRFIRRMERELRAEATEKLKDAKRAHDELERAYHACVDFDAVSELANTEIQRLLQKV